MSWSFYFLYNFPFRFCNNHKKFTLGYMGNDEYAFDINDVNSIEDAVGKATNLPIEFDKKYGFNKKKPSLMTYTILVLFLANWTVINDGFNKNKPSNFFS